MMAPRFTSPADYFAETAFTARRVQGPVLADLDALSAVFHPTHRQHFHLVHVFAVFGAADPLAGHEESQLLKSSSLDGEDKEDEENEGDEEDEEDEWDEEDEEDEEDKADKLLPDSEEVSIVMLVPGLVAHSASPVSSAAL
ncbi:hypothetical protein IWX48DRAFT_637443 [Phyllosticta citricarpa]